MSVYNDDDHQTPFPFWLKQVDKEELKKLYPEAPEAKKAPVPQVLSPGLMEAILAQQLTALLNLGFPEDFKDDKRITQLVDASVQGARAVIKALVEDLKPICSCGNCLLDREKK